MVVRVGNLLALERSITSWLPAKPRTLLKFDLSFKLSPQGEIGLSVVVRG